MENLIGCAVMAAITFPVSFFVARGCLRAVIRLMAGNERRHVLSSQS